MAQYRESRTPTSRGKRLKHMVVKESENGGHIVEHHFEEDGMSYHKPKEYTYGPDEGDDCLSHIAEHAHIKPSASESEEE